MFAGLFVASLRLLERGPKAETGEPIESALAS